jgi:hypothetical protein
MNINKKHLTILIAVFFAVILNAASGLGYGSLTDTRPRISEGEYAIAWVMVQNIMSKHNYYYAAGNRLEELSKIWVKEDGEFAKTATITTIDGVWEGMDAIKIYYGNPKVKDAKQSLKEMSKSSPWEPVKGQLGVYTNTTPIIEVAGDGKTARGVWFSQGMVMIYTGQKDKSGNDMAQGTYYFEKYGADFVKENGEWKIWHIQIYSDFKPSVGSESKWTTPAAAQSLSGVQKSGGNKDEKAHSSAGADLSKPTRENPDPYEQWSPTRENKMRPEIPESYYTFDETTNF